MRIEVDVLAADSVVVRFLPSWWGRLIGRKATEDVAGCVDYTSGAKRWIWRSTYLRIRDPRVLDAIDRALATWRSS